MRVGNTGVGGDAASISYLKADSAAREATASAFPGLGTPTQVFSALTGLLDTGAPMSPATYAAIRGKKVTDLVKACLEDFERQDMSGEDRRKVAAWKALVNDTGAIVTTQCTQDLATRLGATSANLSAATMGSAGMDILTKAVTPDLYGSGHVFRHGGARDRLQLQPRHRPEVPRELDFSRARPDRGLGQPVSPPRQRGLDGALPPERARDDPDDSNTYYASKFAKLVGMLDGIKNADGSTLLDGTATVWFNEMSDGLAQNLKNFPIIQAGSCGGTFKTGWTVNVETAPATLTQGNSEAQCADGTGTGMVNGVTQATGTDPTVATRRSTSTSTT